MKIGMVTLLFAPASALRADETKKVPDRSEIETKYLWATEAIFPNAKAWEEEFAAVEKKVDEIEKLKADNEKMLGVLANVVVMLRDCEKPMGHFPAGGDAHYAYASIINVREMCEPYRKRLADKLLANRKLTVEEAMDG